MTFGFTLAELRRKRGWSQEELALRAGISQRHLSFLETGRSRPGPSSLRELAIALGLRAWEQRALMETLVPPARPSPAPAPDLSIVGSLLRSFSPWPAYAYHPDGTLVATNAALDRLFQLASPRADLWQVTAPKSGPNIYDLVFHPEGLVRWLVNAQEVVPETFRRLQVEAAHDASLSSTITRIQTHPAVARWIMSSNLPSSMLIERYLIKDQTISIISVISHLASPGELELDRLRFESFVPADVQSELFLSTVCRNT